MKKDDKVVYRWGGTETVLGVKDSGLEIWVKDDKTGDMFWTTYENLKLWDDVKQNFEFTPWGVNGKK